MSTSDITLLWLLGRTEKSATSANSRGSDITPHVLGCLICSAISHPWVIPAICVINEVSLLCYLWGVTTQSKHMPQNSRDTDRVIYGVHNSERPPLPPVLCKTSLRRLSRGGLLQSTWTTDRVCTLQWNKHGAMYLHHQQWKGGWPFPFTWSWTTLGHQKMGVVLAEPSIYAGNICNFWRGSHS